MTHTPRLVALAAGLLACTAAAYTTVRLGRAVRALRPGR
jgi:NO-binding membrane sensor protein with MHYT domain